MQKLIEVRAEVNSKGIQPIYQLYHVETPRGVMLHVIFNMLYSLSMEHASADDQENLLHQKAIFELACEEETKSPSIYSEH